MRTLPRRALVGALAVSLLGCAQTPLLVHRATVLASALGSEEVIARPQTANGGWIGGATELEVVPVGEATETHVGLWIDVPQAATATARAPVDLALVVDCSGSMAIEGRLEHAKSAATSMIETLHDGDLVSIYAFSDQVYEYAAPTVVSAASRGTLIQAIARMQTMSGTNLYAGLQAGEARAMAAPPTHAIRRVVVISDGMANVGPSTPDELGALAARGTDHAVQVSAIGVGLQYDERTLGALAMRSSGRLYHLEAPSQMAEILRTEFDRLAHTAATDAYVELVPAEGSELLGVESAQFERRPDGKVRIPLGALHAGQHRELLVRTRLRADRAGARPVASARLVFRDPAGARVERTQQLSLAVQARADAAQGARRADARVAAMVAGHQAAQAQLRAVQLLNEGRAAQAAQEFARVERELQQAQSVAAAAPESVRENLRRQAAGVARSRARATDAAARPASARAAALGANADAYNALGF